MPLEQLAEAAAAGIPGALVCICGIDGGAPKPMGAYMSVLADGRHFGHVSGGCVEPAIAAEVMPLIGTGSDQIIRFGKGSCYIDIRFPCGGGVDLLVHTAPDPAVLSEALARAERREPFAIAFDRALSRARIAGAAQATGWQDGVFMRRHLPQTRLLLAGRGPDFEVMARVAAAAELELRLVTPDLDSAAALADLGVPLEQLNSPGQPLAAPIDEWTALVLLFHEHEWEHALLARAAASPAFYIGALGSRRTHRLRQERLAGMGVPADGIARIRGPIGLIDRARDPGTLALSVLAEIAAARAARDA
ncbi:MAG TPA: XdhC family protein [Devosia sp.]|nr:XdhC family protein [Devosia sp.]